MKGFGNRILSLMGKNNITQGELAKMIGVSPTTMSRYVNDEREPKAETIANLATALHTTTDYLITGQQNDNSFENTYRLVQRGASTLTLEEKLDLMKVLLSDE
ncbi:helix-turn-helix domain-containing protein [Pseudoramibacter sp.]|jgi:transcriptional regulator with XRE-family HTH domain|uniref:helix-turn-helix domain-containing protein n=1 Tax=Pseudoramibacter sp. TaxID=2034862 RepID=UPI0025E2A3C1|nr:helix-turn-helix transcriptional regulator [Pseudoramibacter sp.]MCH4072365.1 helix-turn-helix domain-containing protein [Pseudoramibacter sp.]MCH4106136.1 helix-turn-helix domain-containing protein [Pseudoramibacter sp.]